MEIQKRVSDLSKVVDRQWQANHNYKEIKKYNDGRREHFNKMYNIHEKEDRRKEILEANSAEGRVKRLQENMNALQGNELFRNRNNFR